MEKIGLVAMSAKPYHAGHDALVRLAASDCDEVHLYVSLSNRYRRGEVPILGTDMERLWNDTIEPSLPSNVRVTYGGSPVGNVYKELGDANATGTDNTYLIYGDPDDLKANYVTLGKYAGTLLATERVKLRAVERASTVDVSGTQMRRWLADNDKASFTAMLPKTIDREATWNLLRSTVLNPPNDVKLTERARTASPDPPLRRSGNTGEALLRCYVNLLQRRT